MFKDYYVILDINESANLTEIKSAYKVQALKWHPDKNFDEDTTDKMKDINEAKLILSDNELRIRYDIEYLKFKSFRNNEEKQTKQKNKTKKTKDYSAYQFDDELLKKWMKNARKQAINNVYEMINEFRDSSYVAFATFFKTAIMAITIYLIYKFITSLLI